jgi:chromosome partitioning protein
LSFNLAYELAHLNHNVVTVDCCPQQNLSEILLKGDWRSHSVNLYDAFLSRITPGSRPSQTSFSISVSSTCPSFAGKRVMLIPGSSDLYLFPGLFYNQLSVIRNLPNSSSQREAAKNLLNALNEIVETEISLQQLSAEQTKVIIDTSPFFGGATHLACHAVDGLIVPVRVDHQSIHAFELLLRMLMDPQMEFITNASISEGLKKPKIHAVLVTHCGWSRQKKKTPDNSTKVFVDKVLGLISKYPQLFSTTTPANHLFLLDDFLTSGRISNEKSRPLATLNTGQSFSVGGKKLSVNPSVERYKKQLKYIASVL